MNSEEQTLIDGLFSRLQQAERDAAPRDAQAEARIKEHLTRQPAAGYFMTQAIRRAEPAARRASPAIAGRTAIGQGAGARRSAERWWFPVEYFRWCLPRHPCTQRTAGQRGLA
jgi:hypothetical protein